MQSFQDFRYECPESQRFHANSQRAEPKKELSASRYASIFESMSQCPGAAQDPRCCCRAIAGFCSYYASAASPSLRVGLPPRCAAPGQGGLVLKALSPYPVTITPG